MFRSSTASPVRCVCPQIRQSGVQGGPIPRVSQDLAYHLLPTELLTVLSHPRIVVRLLARSKTKRRARSCRSLRNGKPLRVVDPRLRHVRLE